MTTTKVDIEAARELGAKVFTLLDLSDHMPRATTTIDNEPIIGCSCGWYESPRPGTADWYEHFKAFYG